MKALVKQLIQRIKDKDDACKLLYQSAAEEVMKFHTPGLKNRKYYVDPMLEFAKVQKGKQAIARLGEEIKSGKNAESALAAVSDVIRDAQQLSATESKLLKWADVEAIAETQKADWIVDQILEGECLTVFTGLPFSGKTTVVSALIAAIAQGKDLFGFKTRKVPICFVNADRTRERIVFKHRQVFA